MKCYTKEDPAEIETYAQYKSRMYNRIIKEANKLVNEINTSSLKTEDKKDFKESIKFIL